MDSYSILGIEKESSMEDIEKAYIDKISKIKKEVKMNMMTTMIINLKRERKRRPKEGLILKAKRIKK